MWIVLWTGVWTAYVQLGSRDTPGRLQVAFLGELCGLWLPHSRNCVYQMKLAPSRLFSQEFRCSRSCEMLRLCLLAEPVRVEVHVF